MASAKWMQAVASAGKADVLESRHRGGDTRFSRGFPAGRLGP
jgi:hypothetical protein